MIHRFIAQPKNGAINFQNQDRESFLEALKHFDGKFVWITIQKMVGNRTAQQNKYYWAVPVALMSEYWGYEKDEVHEVFKWKFLLVPGEDGKPDRARGTSSLNKDEWQEYIEQIQRWAALEFGVVIPDPNQTEFV